jgi:flagellin-like protein
MLSLPPRNENASSPVTGVVLLLGITFILVMLMLLLCLGFRLPEGETPVPTIFEITRIRHTNPQGVLDNDSYMVIKNSGPIAYDNRKLYAKTYRNGVHLPCDIPTMNGNDFLPTHHFGIQTLGGFGSHDFLWYPDATIAINYAKGTFHPGDTVRFEVYDRTTQKIVSRDTYPKLEKYDTQWFYNYFLNPQAA